MDRPHTYSAFEFMTWVLENQDELILRSPSGHSTPLSKLPPRELCHWASRMFYDNSTPVRSQAQWMAIDEAKVQAPPSPF